MEYIAIKAIDISELAVKLNELSESETIKSISIAVDNGIAYAIVTVEDED